MIFLPAVRSRKRARMAAADVAISWWAGGGQRWRGMGDTKRQHLAAIRGGRSAMPVTGLTIHDIVISPRFPKPYFFS